MKFRKKPVVIEAYRTDKEVVIHTLEGDMKASVGDYIITGVNGEQYPCKPDIFEKTYELVGRRKNWCCFKKIKNNWVVILPTAPQALFCWQVYLINQFSEILDSKNIDVSGVLKVAKDYLKGGYVNG